VPVRDFERHFGHLLEDGLVMPFYVSLETIAEGPSLAGRYKPLADSKRRKSFSCFSGALLKRYSDDDELRTIVSKRILTAPSSRSSSAMSVISRYRLGLSLSRTS
jgi:hypothetical protein